MAVSGPSGSIRDSPVPQLVSRAAAPTYTADYLLVPSSGFSARKPTRFDGEFRRGRLESASDGFHPSRNRSCCRHVKSCSYEPQFIGSAAPCHFRHGFYAHFAVKIGPLIPQRRQATFTRSVGLLRCHAWCRHDTAESCYVPATDEELPAACLSLYSLSCFSCGVCVCV
jgi:hypothetical protein